MSNPVLNQERVAFLQARAEVRKVFLPEWPRQQKELKMVELEVDWVRFSTINHRTRAEQLRVQHLRANPDLFTSDPLGAEAQTAQYEILRSQEGFAAIKKDLQERGQNQPAIVTAEGILINGNRRTAALRSLFQDDHYLKARYVQCLVLPEDATADELIDLEAELQVARDFKEDYSWVNEAFLIEELYQREGHSLTHVAAKMHRDESAVRSLYEKLQQLHQLVSLSKGTRLHIDFKDNESAFDELAKYINTRNRTNADRDSVRSAYFLGTLVGVNYRDLRHLRRSDAADLILKEIKSDPSLSSLLSAAQAPVDPDGLGDVFEDLFDSTASAPSELNGLLGTLATKKAEEIWHLPSGDSVSVLDVHASIQSAIRAAAAEAEEEAREQLTVTTPTQRVDEALVKLRAAINGLPRARALAEWNEAAFAAKLVELRKIVKQLDAADQ